MKLKILLVDDDHSLLDIMSRMLAHRGHEVQTCATPFGVSALVLRDQPEVVILDVMMPGLGGAALANLIAGLDLKRRPRVALWSAMDEDALRDAARAAGGVPAISKAMRASEIANAIERVGAEPALSEA